MTLRRLSLPTGVLAEADATAAHSPPRIVVHEAAAGAVRLHGIVSPCTCVDVPWIVITHLSLQSWHLLLCHVVLAEAAASAVLAIARPPLALFSRQSLVLSASMVLSAHARALATLMPVRRLSLPSRQCQHGFQKGFGKHEKELLWQLGAVSKSVRGEKD